MRKEDLYKAFNDIDDEFLKEALEKKQKKDYSLLLRGLAFTMAFVLCVTIGLRVNSLSNKGSNIIDGVHESDIKQFATLNGKTSSTLNYSTINGANETYHYGIDENYTSNANKTLMVVLYGDNKGQLVESISNGTYIYSEMLNEALSQLQASYQQQTVNYRVVVRLFKDGTLVTNEKLLMMEFERLGKEGYITAYETYTDSSVSESVLTIHASYDNLSDFKSNSDYGYQLLLYGEVFDLSEDQIQVYNAAK